MYRLHIGITIFALIVTVGIAAGYPSPALYGQEAPGETIPGSLYLPFISANFPTPTPTNTATQTPTLTPTATNTPTQPPSPTASATPTPPPPATPPAASMRRVNAPFFNGEIPFEQTAIFWFGRLSESSNYADVRVGYNQEKLTVYLAIFDRHLWYDEAPTTETLTDWDAVTLLLDVNPDAGMLSGSSYRFVAQLSGDASARHRATYQGGSQGWLLRTLNIATKPGWRGEALNNNNGTDRGWAMTFDIPFTALGLSAAPAAGSEWRLGLLLHDRDGRNEAPQPVQTWPETLQRDQPATWGRLRFGLPGYTAPNIPAAGEVLIRRERQNDPTVIDADVGGAITNQCPGDDYHIWNEWANRNYGKAPDFNIQNQSDVADWPCFAKYYVTFPLEAVPPGKIILSATLTLHQFGNAGGSEAQPSWIQVLTAAEDWQETTITWNNAPLAWENITGRWVDPVGNNWNGWPGIPWSWDVSYAVANAYANHQPVRLILYEADSAYHSGKYFVSSDTGDWNIAGRPTLRVVWGER
ncbi:MAG: hypothetical protein KatS3mg049_0725 [Caldilinea sp.]|uniref:Carbohydrate-binding module family 96 domain-containing protein n=2 Tax=Caldilineaceae TaxID=475964 RepID=I0I6D8_CALAS|nr:hypothetical protein CLDAP_27860 [Caldilinea aerophila DSM 14535 = NBRC 104270]GIV72169.1 MAG: hypothetical protein KatS3mg049_0725 [Caldilinea sp.]